MFIYWVGDGAGAGKPGPNWEVDKLVAPPLASLLPSEGLAFFCSPLVGFSSCALPQISYSVAKTVLNKTSYSLPEFTSDL